MQVLEPLHSSTPALQQLVSDANLISDTFMHACIHTQKHTHVYGHSHLLLSYMKHTQYFLRGNKILFEIFYVCMVLYNGKKMVEGKRFLSVNHEVIH